MTSIRPVAIDILRAAALLPVSVARSGTALKGHDPHRLRRLLHAGTGILLGAVAFVLVGMELLVIARGALYGFVDQGPYDHSWGGPTRTGAWLAHFLLSLPVVAGGLGLLWFIAGLDDRLGARFVRGERTGAWALPVALLLSAGAVVFVIAWTHQL
ncbi:hypothetical protein [Streptomyces sp. LaPpAH-108]|uniref:hypothetical protein n=1 Tax=Streptomyces sp. LaPpAH-108 TaxID=1155714 RepID=UPI000370A169|nr:hypothetical protein [Streptomyces sp. LaPpAH-108]